MGESAFDFGSLRFGLKENIMRAYVGVSVEKREHAPCAHV